MPYIIQVELFVWATSLPVILTQMIGLWVCYHEHWRQPKAARVIGSAILYSLLLHTVGLLAQNIFLASFATNNTSAMVCLDGSISIGTSGGGDPDGKGEPVVMMAAAISIVNEILLVSIWSAAFWAVLNRTCHLKTRCESTEKVM